MADVSHASDCRANAGAFPCDCGARLYPPALKAFKFKIGRPMRRWGELCYSDCFGVAIARDVEEAKRLLFASLEARVGVHAGWVNVADVTEMPLEIGVLGWSMI